MPVRAREGRRQWSPQNGMLRIVWREGGQPILFRSVFVILQGNIEEGLECRGRGRTHIGG